MSLDCPRGWKDRHLLLERYLAAHVVHVDGVRLDVTDNNRVHIALS